MMISSLTTMAPITSSSMRIPLHEQLLPVKGLSDTVFVGKTTQQQKQQQQPIIIPNSRPSSTINAIPKKPMRPLTAYHIFFQIEREFVIQTTAGEDADKSIHDNKVYLDDVPLRYKNIKLLPDWYAGPGKRQKRKHRKQHGKIGFLELSRVISTRWAQLGEVDPETKAFVQKIAKQELDEYYREMKEYKELTKDLVVPMHAAKASSTEMGSPTSSATKKKSKKQSGSKINVPSKMTAPQQKPFMAPLPDTMLSSSFDAANLTSLRLKNDIDYFLSCIDNKTQHLLPQKKKIAQQQQHQQSSTPFFPSTFCGTITEISNQEVVPKKRKTFHRQDSALSVSNFDLLLDNNQQKFQDMQPMLKRQRRTVSDYDNNDAVSSSSSSDNTATASSSGCTSPASFEVDICDDEILQLWKSHN